MSIIASLILVLAIFFQLNRTDWFARTFSSKNLLSVTAEAKLEDIEAWNDLGRDNILCIYDSTSVYEVSKYLRKLKKNVVSQKIFEAKDFTGYDAVLLMLDSLADSSEELLTSLDKYVKEGNVGRDLITEFNSNNTDLLNVEEVQQKLLSLEYIKEELAAWEASK